jgi:hypothetical protein
MKRICQYRNCGCSLPDIKRISAKYCNKKCKDNERTYIKRENKRINENKENIAKMLVDIEKNKDLLELFKLIHKS